MKKSSVKKPVIPKSVEYVSQIFTEILSGKHEDASIGTILYPSALSEDIKDSGGQSPHTTTIQNLYDIGALFKQAQEQGWEIIEVKEGYNVLQRTRESSMFKEINKNLEEIKNKL